MIRNMSRMRAAILALLSTLLVLAPGTAIHAQTSPRSTLAPAVRAFGDLDEILARRQFRLIVPYSKTQFYIDRGRQMGVAAEFGLELEKWLNARHRKDGLPIVVVFLPTPLDRLLPALLEGRGDAVSANLTITPERREIVDFAPPWLSGVDEVLVSACPRDQRLPLVSAGAQRGFRGTRTCARAHRDGFRTAAGRGSAADGQCRPAAVGVRRRSPRRNLGADPAASQGPSGHRVGQER
jgi:hypothetical protein